MLVCGVLLDVFDDDGEILLDVMEPLPQQLRIDARELHQRVGRKLVNVRIDVADDLRKAREPSASVGGLKMGDALLKLPDSAAYQGQ